MDRFWKQFAVSGTASSHNVFLKARLKLTALYVLIIAIIILGFSMFLYQTIERNLRTATDDDFADTQSHDHFIEKTLSSVENDLILADISILVIAAGLSFALAGKTLKPIQLSVEAQKAFAANASHELRTPLAVMRNDIEVTLRNASPTRDLAEKTMKSNLEEISRMSNIVEDLLVLARSDNQIASPSTDIDISALLEAVIERTTPLAESKNIKLTYTAAGPIHFKGVHDQIERIVLNILQNSMDHTPGGGSIHVSLVTEGSCLMICIADTGSGIAAKDLPHIFKRFYKGDSTTGTGLGLSIVKELVEAHKGQLSFQSAEGKGTTVCIRFPVV